jgi:hypothetical protein
MSIEEKRRIVSDHCYNIGDCDKCVLNDSSKNWKNTLSTIDCLDIRESDEEDIDKAIKLIEESKDLDKAHDTDKLVIPNVLRSKFNLPPHKVNDSVNSPSHYTDGKIEVIDYIEDKKLGFCLGNAIKYISRAGKKNEEDIATDIKKAIWYLNRYLKQLEEA